VCEVQKKLSGVCKFCRKIASQIYTSIVAIKSHALMLMLHQNDQKPQSPCYIFSCNSMNIPASFNRNQPINQSFYHIF